MDSRLVKEKLMAASSLLSGPTTTLQKFHSVRSLLKGINPKLDRILDECAGPVAHLEKMQNLEVIELSAEAIPETTEEQKKRKKYLLLFIRHLKLLRDEVRRVNSEFDRMHGSHSDRNNGLKAWGRILSFAKGPLGLVTLAAVLIVSAGFVRNYSQNTYKHGQTISSVTSSDSARAAAGVRGIIYQGKSIPLSALSIGTGPDCSGGGVPHYHAKDEISVTALDGTRIPDPGGCGYGKVSGTAVVVLGN